MEERFWSKVQKGKSCWNWTASTDSTYGQFGVLGKTFKAHRYSYQQAKGPVPKGLELDHLCRNQLCVNPDHLEAVTHKENCRRGLGAVVAGLMQSNKKRCPKGHRYFGKNIYLDPRGFRQCRKCRSEISRRIRAAKK